MPHMNATGADDLSCTDEVKVYKDEGEEEEQEKSSENLTEDKVGLVIEGEGQTPLDFDFLTKNGGASFLKVPFAAADPRFASYFLSPYPSYSNGAHSGFGAKVPLVPTVPSPFSLMSLYVNDAFAQPPPAHRSALTDPKTGLPSSMYTIPTPPPGHQLSPLYSADFAAAAAAWGVSTGPTGGQSGPHGVAHPTALRGSPYVLPGGTGPSPHSMAGHFSSSMLAAAAAVAAGGHHSFHPALFSSLGAAAAHHHHHHHPSLHPHPHHSGLASQGPGGQHPSSLHHPHHPQSAHTGGGGGGGSRGSCASSSSRVGVGGGGGSHRDGGVRSSSSHHPGTGGHMANHFARSVREMNESEKAKNHIKKPLNAFMLFMKEMRPKVQEECTLKESAAINQILGKKWHELSREDQSKYYELARKEKELHLQLYPNWSARDNYAVHTKRKKKRKTTMDGSSMGMGGEHGLEGRSDMGNPKKCRARFGLEHQNQWCKPCRRKKKCIRFISDNEEGDDGVHSDTSPNLMGGGGGTGGGGDAGGGMLPGSTPLNGCSSPPANLPAFPRHHPGGRVEDDTDEEEDDDEEDEEEFDEDDYDQLKSSTSPTRSICTPPAPCSSVEHLPAASSPLIKQEKNGHPPPHNNTLNHHSNHFEDDDDHPCTPPLPASQDDLILDLKRSARKRPAEEDLLLPRTRVQEGGEEARLSNKDTSCTDEEGVVGPLDLKQEWCTDTDDSGLETT